MIPRLHQIAMAERAAWLAESPKAFYQNRKTTLVAVPGAGKSACVVSLASALAAKGRINGVLWVTPRKLLEIQAADDLAKLHGLQTLSTNYCSLVAKIDHFTHWVERVKKVLLVADEFHHLAVEPIEGWTNWGTPYTKLASNDKVAHQLLMSGTPYRKDRYKCVQIDYDLPHQFQITDRSGRVLNREGQRVQADITYRRAEALPDPAGPAIIPLNVHYLDGPVEFNHPTRGHYAGQLSDFGETIETDPVIAAALRAFLDHPKAWRRSIRYAIKHWVRSKGQHKSQVLITAASIADAVLFADEFYAHREEWGCPEAIAGIAVADGHLAAVEPVDPGDLLQIGEDGQVERDLAKQSYVKSMHQWRIRCAKQHVVDKHLMPDSEEAVRLFRRRDIEVLITIGKAYEGLDAPGCTHLVHLGVNRSDPWLTQCFARAWRRDYHPSAPPVEQQRAHVFLPADIRARRVVEFITQEVTEHLTQVKSTKSPEPITEQERERLREMFDGFKPVPSGGGACKSEVLNASANRVYLWQEVGDTIDTIEITEEDP